MGGLGDKVVNQQDFDLRPLAYAAQHRAEAQRKWEDDPTIDPHLKAPLNRRERKQLIETIFPTKTSPASPKITHLFRSALGWGGGLSAALVLLCVGINSKEQHAGLPAFHLEVISESYSPTRGENLTRTTLQLKAGMRIDIVLRPETQFHSPTMDARVRVKTLNRFEPLEWTPQISSTGSIRFTGTIGREVILPETSTELVFAIGPHKVLRAWQGPPLESIQLLRQDIALMPSAPQNE